MTKWLVDDLIQTPPPQHCYRTIVILAMLFSFVDTHFKWKRHIVMRDIHFDLHPPINMQYPATKPLGEGRDVTSSPCAVLWAFMDDEHTSPTCPFIPDNSTQFHWQPQCKRMSAFHGNLYSNNLRHAGLLLLSLLRHWRSFHQWTKQLVWFLIAIVCFT